MAPWGVRGGIINSLRQGTELPFPAWFYPEVKIPLKLTYIIVIGIDFREAVQKLTCFSFVIASPSAEGRSNPKELSEIATWSLS